MVGQAEDREKLEEASTIVRAQWYRSFRQINPENWYNAANVKIFASRCEGSPNVVLEALACGTPVVASYAGRNAMVIQERKQGRLFLPEDAESLKTALLQALDYKWNREEDCPLRQSAQLGNGCQRS